MIEVKEDTYVLAIWFVGWKNADWMMAVWRDGAGADWTLKYRFRYYDSPPEQGFDAFDGKDRKSWYGGTIPKEMTAEDILPKMRLMAAGIAVAQRGEVVETIFRTTGVKDFMDIFVRQPYVHVKQMKAGEKPETRMGGKS